jgi:hypothetical protein
MGMYGDTRLDCYVGGFVLASPNYYMNSLSSGWHHLAGVGHGGVTDFYIDGLYVATASAQVASSNLMYVGNHNSASQPFSDKIDEVRVYNSALTPAQIADIVTYGASLPPSTYAFQRSILRSSSAATRWRLSVPAHNIVGNKVDVQDSDASYGSLVLALGSIGVAQNNLNWKFAGGGVPFDVL